MFGTVLTKTAENALAVLGKSGLMSDAYLAGGSALALYFGHRHSEDFDFFSPNSFNPAVLCANLKKIGNFKESLVKGITLLGDFNRVKFSYFEYDYPLIAETSDYLGIRVADPKDIAAMKLAAVMDRGTRRDFVDLYTLVKRGVILENMFSYYDQKYHWLESNLFSLIKALQYFDEADSGEMPRMIEKYSWEEIKIFFVSESQRLARKFI